MNRLLSETRADRLAGLFEPATVVLFAGLGGVCIGVERAYVEGGYADKYIDLAVNHWDTAVDVHELNHPMTQHLHCDVWEVDPNAVLLGRKIAYLHASPDCVDFSKAKGGKPKRKHIRALADVVLVWAGKRRPDVITLENVEEFLQWGPLDRHDQPDKARRGEEFQRWKRELEALGYVVEHKELRACDYGTPTTRKRLFVIARCDGKPIVWPEKTHGNVQASPGSCRTAPGKAAIAPASRLDVADVGVDRLGVRSGRSGPRRRSRQPAILKPYNTAAGCIDFRQPMLSIFATRPEAREWSKAVNVGRAKVDRVGIPQRPLKPKTQERMAGGLLKWVLNAAEPFIIRTDMHQSNSGCVYGTGDPLTTVTSANGHAVADVSLYAGTFNHGGDDHRTADLRGPLHTVTGANDARGLVGVFTAGVGGRAGQSPATPVDAPIPTVTGKADRVVATAHLAPFTCGAGGPVYSGKPRPVTKPSNTVMVDDRQALVAVALNKHFGGVVGQAADVPLGTVTGVDHNSLLAVSLTNYHGEKGGETRGQRPDEPIRTLDTQNRFAAVAAHLVKFRGESPGTSCADPIDTITAGSHSGRPAGAGHAMGLATVYLSHMYTSNTCGGQGDPRKPLKTITSGGQHAKVCVVYLSPYYGEGSGKTGHGCGEPAPTVVSKARLALCQLETTPHWVFTEPAMRRARQVGRWALKMLGKKVREHLLWVADEAGKKFPLLFVALKGAIHLVTDIAMRMLRPRELARAQGFPDSYVIDRTRDGKPVSKADQVKLIGNSVPPHMAHAIAKANVVLQGVMEDAREAVPA